MPKPYTFPTLYNEALQISISKLKEWEYLNKPQIKGGVVTWSRNGIKTSSISIEVNTQCPKPYIDLSYNYKGESRNYKVRLVSVKSNLGNGHIWYFRCPNTHKRCRKLYLISGYLLHREAFKGCMYETQTLSKKNRHLDKIIGLYFRTDELYSELYKKHLKKTYAGKPTKKYLRLIEKIQRAERIPEHEVERLLLI